MLAQCVSDFSTQYGLPTSLLLAGLVGGATHCSLMCAPFVLAQTKENVRLERPAPYLLIPYHLGRMTTYTALAVLVNSVLNLAFIFSDMRVIISAPLLMLAGIIFLVSAFPQLRALFPWAAYLRISAPYKYINRLSSGLIQGPRVLKRYMLGVLLGFMPCGLVISALLAAATAETTLYAAVSMIAFTLGTIPSLIIIALGGYSIQSKYPMVTKHLSRGAMALSSLWLFILAGTLIF